MGQWIAIGIEVLFNLCGLAYLWGKFSEKVAFMRGEIKGLQDNSQTPKEREALAKNLQLQFDAHEAKDDLRFKSLSDAINDKLDKLDKLDQLDHITRTLNELRRNGKQ